MGILHRRILCRSMFLSLLQPPIVGPSRSLCHVLAEMLTANPDYLLYGILQAPFDL